MRARLGLRAAALAGALVLTTPGIASADETDITTTAPTTTTAGDEQTTTTLDDATTTTTTDSSTSTSSTTSTPTTATTNATTTTSPAADLPALAPVTPIAPARPGPATPSRGTQKQVVKPPPPPTTQAPWDPFLLPANSGWGRRVVYSKSKQTVWVLDSNNTVIKSHRVSGRQTPLDPRPGTYSVWSRSRYTFSINNPSITWGYMIRFAKGAQGGNIGFHEIPFQYGRPVQSIWQLGQPLSGGCVRQWVGDAIWMWNWAGIGTKVVVTP